VLQRRQKVDSGTYVGSGKAIEIAHLAQKERADVVVFDNDLSPGQIGALEKIINEEAGSKQGERGIKVLDRSELILDIFATRAQTHEAKLQVELAQMQYTYPRLARMWGHLERLRGQGGGMGIGTRGPGETQLETDRRLLGKRVKVLKEKLAKVRRQREVQRRARSRAHVLSVSLVGYTNAGKSTLFNRLTRADAYAADKLFATLDTTTRRMHLANGGAVVLSDTVGFIRRLPHSLVAAFRATLEETARADLLLHVVDASSINREAQISAVNEVLSEIGAAALPQLLVYNKIDRTRIAARIERDEYGRIARAWISAKSGEGLDLVRLALEEYASGTLHRSELIKSPAAA
jgi:GTP-binding protein HflX